MSQFPWSVSAEHQRSLRYGRRDGKMHAAVALIYKSLLNSDPVPMKFKAGRKEFKNAVEFAEFSLDCLIKWNAKQRNLHG